MIGDSGALPEQPTRRAGTRFAWPPLTHPSRPGPGEGPSRLRGFAAFGGRVLPTASCPSYRRGSPVCGGEMRNRSRRPRSMPRTGRGSALQVRPQLVTLEDRTLMSVDLWSAFPGLTTSAAPPDTTGAAGPDYVLEAINLSAAWYDK